MISEAAERRVVDQWLKSRWRVLTVIAGMASAAAVLTASCIEIVKAIS